MWGCSSSGRALQWHWRGREFESLQLHHLSVLVIISLVFLILLLSWFSSLFTKVFTRVSYLSFKSPLHFLFPFINRLRYAGDIPSIFAIVLKVIIITPDISVYKYLPINWKVSKSSTRSCLNIIIMMTIKFLDFLLKEFNVENVAHFMVQLITDNGTWSKWKGDMPVIYNDVTDSWFSS